VVGEGGPRAQVRGEAERSDFVERPVLSAVAPHQRQVQLGVAPRDVGNAPQDELAASGDLEALVQEG
jgi:hypothetical protein